MPGTIHYLLFQRIFVPERFREAGQDDWGQRDRLCIASSEIFCSFVYFMAMSEFWPVLDVLLQP